MSRRRLYLTTTIPYVNGDPHLGHALEFVQADVLARHHRLRGDDVRFLSGTDDNALKNVQAAQAARIPVANFVRAKARRFAELRDPLKLSYDDFISTSVDLRHRPGVERLWRACQAAGDLYSRDYVGLYCIGCEAFVTEDELVDGRCAEHGVAPEEVAERNWFFRLSRYADQLGALVDSGRLGIEPRERRNEVLSFIRSGLTDFSVSRSVARARGWGIPVPGDPTQIVYVWFDALANYITALDSGGDRRLYGTWWETSDERVHVVGKGVIRFHAVYWPAILLSAGAALPTSIFVHDYLSANGRKLSKSLDNAVDPVGLCCRYGRDAVRWWFVRDVARSGDTDFREELLAARADELANGVGNLVNRTIALVRRYRPDGCPLQAPAQGVAPGGGADLAAAVEQTPATIDEALARFDFRAASAAVWNVVVEGNRFAAATRPWELGKAAATGDVDAAARLDGCLALLVAACERIGRELQPFLPGASVRIEEALSQCDPELGRRLFPKVGAIERDRVPAG